MAAGEGRAPNGLEQKLRKLDWSLQPGAGRSGSAGLALRGSRRTSSIIAFRAAGPRRISLEAAGPD